MKDYRNSKFKRFIIDLKWKIIKGTRGPRGLVMILLVAMTVFIILNVVVNYVDSQQAAVEELKPICKSVCDYLI